MKHVHTVVFLLALLSSCRSEQRAPQHHDDHKEHGESHETKPGAANAKGDLLRVEQTMLRDLRITTAAAVSRPAGEAVTMLGELGPNEDAYAEVGSPIPARIVKLHAAPSDRVKAGQALVELESAEVGRARAAIDSAQARLKLSQQTVARRRDLAKDQIVPEREMQQSEAELSEVQAEHRAAQLALSALSAVRGQGAKFTLTSPVDGTVIERNAVRGRMVNAEELLYTVGDLNRLWLAVQAFERDALRVKVGAQARASFAALPNESFPGTVTLIGSRVDPTSRTVAVRIELENPQAVLRPGMSATAVIPIGDSKQTVIAVPVQAVQRIAQQWCVFVPSKEEGEFEVRRIGRGRDLGAELEVLSGLKAGERVVVDGAFLLKAEAEKASGGENEHHH